MTTTNQAPAKGVQATALTIGVSVATAPSVILDAGVVARVASLAEDAEKILISTPADANVAAQTLREITGLAKDIEKAREEVKRPFFEAGKAIDAAANAQKTKLVSAGDTIRARLSRYQAEQERLAREEAERQRKEQERLAAEAARVARERAELEKRQREEAERAAAAANAASPAEDDDGLGDLAAEVETEKLAQEQARIAAAATQLAQTRAVVAPAKPAGIHYRTTLKFQVTDVSRLPDNLVIVTPNEAEIRRLFVTGWKEGDALPTVPGIAFTIDKQAVVTGRRY